jgi:hypothetical protein
VAANSVGTASSSVAGTMTRLRPSRSATSPAKGAAKATARVEMLISRLVVPGTYEMCAPAPAAGAAGRVNQEGAETGQHYGKVRRDFPSVATASSCPG